MNIEQEKKRLTDVIAKTTTLSKFRKMYIIDLINNLERLYMYEIERQKTILLEQIINNLKNGNQEKADNPNAD